MSVNSVLINVYEFNYGTYIYQKTVFKILVYVCQFVPDNIRNVLIDCNGTFTVR